jgi:hypothetical protein
MMGDQRYFGKASNRTSDAAIAPGKEFGIGLQAAIVSRQCPLWVKSGHYAAANQCPLTLHLATPLRLYRSKANAPHRLSVPIARKK